MPFHNLIVPGTISIYVCPASELEPVPLMQLHVPLRSRVVFLGKLEQVLFFKDLVPCMYESKQNVT